MACVFLSDGVEERPKPSFLLMVSGVHKPEDHREHYGKGGKHARTGIATYGQGCRSANDDNREPLHPRRGVRHAGNDTLDHFKVLDAIACEISLGFVFHSSSGSQVACRDEAVNPSRPWVVSQFETSFLYGPRRPSFGARASIRPTIHSMSRSVSDTPAAIAGDKPLSDLCCRQKL